MNIIHHSQGNAIKLYVYIDRPNKNSEHPKLVIINRYKLVQDLRIEFAYKYNLPYEDQYWLINKSRYDDEIELNEAVKDVQPYKSGYICFLFVISRSDNNNIPQFIDSYLVDKYLKVDPLVRWKDPIDDPIIIADSIDSKKPMPVIGWACECCTTLNKAYKECCDVCGNSCPSDYKIPHNFFWTEQDLKIVKQLEDEKIKQKQQHEENQKREAIERDEYRKKLELMYKDKVTYTTVVSECPICTMDYEAGDSVVLHSCLHTVCKDCLKAYLTEAIDPKVKCPTENCVGIIEDGEISGILTDDEYKKYEQLSLRTAEAKTDNTFHCTTPNCTAWVVYDDDVNFFDCPMCTKKNCLLCKAIHDNQTCKEYQDEMVIKARNDEAAKKDLEFLENMIKTGQAMKCPKCQILIQKKDGCDWMKCNMCQTELCWATKGPRWGPNGPGDNSGGCRCRLNNKRCVPHCINCH